MSAIAIIGAGYAGLLAANRAAARGHDITLINETAHFVDRIRLHQVIAGTRAVDLVTLQLSEMVDARVRLIIGRAERVSTGAVELVDGRRIDATHVVVATGSAPPRSNGSLEWATKHAASIASLPSGSRVSVRGAGLTGIEVATEIAEARPQLQVSLVDPQSPGAGLSAAARRHLTAAFDRLAVTVHTGPMQADHTIDCTGFDHDSLGASSGLSCAGHLIEVDAYFRVPGLDRVWGIGDAVRVTGSPDLRMGCSAAEPMAALLTRQIDRHDRGRPLQPVSIGYAAQCVSLGRRDGVIQWVHRDDRALPFISRGRTAAAIKEGICRFALAAPKRWSRYYVPTPGPARG